jgi:stage V sporulation protein G
MKYVVKYSQTILFLRKVGLKNMEITDIRVRKINSEGRMKAVVSVTFDGEFVVHDIKVIEGQEKLFVAMPSRKTPDGEFKDIAHPINSTMRERLQGAIISKYEEVRELEAAEAAANDSAEETSLEASTEEALEEIPAE